MALAIAFHFSWHRIYSPVTRMAFSRCMPHSSVYVRKTIRNQSAAQVLRRFTKISNRIHREYLDDPVILNQYEYFLAWQVSYMSPFYDDFRTAKDYADAVDFVISDLTGIGISKRDQDMARLIPVMTKMLPKRALQALADAMRLNARILQINYSIYRDLYGSRQENTDISERDYCLSCRRASKLDDCLELVSLTRRVGEDLDRIIRIPVLGVILRAMRAPARLAGFGDMQNFLEKGYSTFGTIGDIGKFLDEMSARMMEVFTRIYNEPLKNLRR